jgi:hypothetical protein
MNTYEMMERVLFTGQAVESPKRRALDKLFDRSGFSALDEVVIAQISAPFDDEGPDPPFRDVPNNRNEVLPTVVLSRSSCAVSCKPMTRRAALSPAPAAAIDGRLSRWMLVESCPIEAEGLGMWRRARRVGEATSDVSFRRIDRPSNSPSRDSALRYYHATGRAADLLGRAIPPAVRK